MMTNTKAFSGFAMLEDAELDVVCGGSNRTTLMTAGGMSPSASAQTANEKFDTTGLRAAQPEVTDSTHAYDAILSSMGVHVDATPTGGPAAAPASDEHEHEHEHEHHHHCHDDDDK